MMFGGIDTTRPLEPIADRAIAAKEKEDADKAPKTQAGSVKKNGPVHSGPLQPE